MVTGFAMVIRFQLISFSLLSLIAPLPIKVLHSTIVTNADNTIAICPGYGTFGFSQIRLGRLALTRETQDVFKRQSNRQFYYARREERESAKRRVDGNCLFLKTSKRTLQSRLLRQPGVESSIKC